MAQGLGKLVRLVLKPAAHLYYQELENLWNKLDRFMHTYWSRDAVIRLYHVVWCEDELKHNDQTDDGRCDREPEAGVHIGLVNEVAKHEQCKEKVDLQRETRKRWGEW